ncbi:MAG TPA: substrate-binding domain-containing protein [Candidatus Limnocylindria bacterium]|jgi:putative molybdopterin biosynthesis protein|nr:substrate-binding domain-containing protein [Candidatus Limnocylindria bacterium]
MSLEARRRERGISQRELALAAGLTRQAIGAIESGRAQPSIAVAFSLARVLDTTVEELFASAREQAEAGEEPRDDPGATPSRFAAARVGERIVTRALAGELLATEPAQDEGPGVESTIFVAGCDTGIGLLAGHLNLAARGYRAIWFSATNRTALADLRTGRAHVAAIHGTDEELRRVLAARGTARHRAIAFAAQDEGWLIGRGNPRGFRDAAQVLRASVTIANRPRGSAARALLDAQLRAARREPETVPGYARELDGQLDAGRAVSAGFADAAIGLRSVARLFDLQFLPLRAERVVLVVPETHLAHPGVAALLETLRGEAFRRDLGALGAYDVGSTGEVVRPS